MRFASALVVFAYPDDAEYMCGGTVAAWARAGTEVHYCVITDGAAGSNEPDATREEMAVIREREQRAAAGVLGARLLRARRALHDAHPRRDAGLGRLRHRPGAPRRAHGLRRGGGARE